MKKMILICGCLALMLNVLLGLLLSKYDYFNMGVVYLKNYLYLCTRFDI